jgi:hypothetical protein
MEEMDEREIFETIKKEYNLIPNKEDNPLRIRLGNFHTIQGYECIITNNCKPINNKEQCKYGTMCKDSIFDTSYKMLDVKWNEINLNDETKGYLNFIVENNNKKNNLLGKINDKLNNIGKYYYTENKKIDKMITTNLNKKDKIIETKNKKFMLEYNKIEELNYNINKKKKEIDYYLNMLKYLIPILIVLILIKILI